MQKIKAKFNADLDDVNVLLHLNSGEPVYDLMGRSHLVSGLEGTGGDAIGFIFGALEFEGLDPNTNYAIVGVSNRATIPNVGRNDNVFGLAMHCDNIDDEPEERIIKYIKYLATRNIQVLGIVVDNLTDCFETPPESGDLVMAVRVLREYCMHNKLLFAMYHPLSDEAHDLAESSQLHPADFTLAIRGGGYHSGCRKLSDYFDTSLIVDYTDDMEVVITAEKMRGTLAMHHIATVIIETPE